MDNDRLPSRPSMDSFESEHLARAAYEAYDALETLELATDNGQSDFILYMLGEQSRHALTKYAHHMNAFVSAPYN